MIGERARLQFRAEAFNFTNSPLPYTPTTDVNNREIFGTARAGPAAVPAPGATGAKATVLGTAITYSRSASIHNQRETGCTHTSL